MSEIGSHESEAVVAARRELHELTVLSTALLRLATKVHTRCETLRTTLGDLTPVDDAEVERHAPTTSRTGAPSRPRRASRAADDAEDPVALLATSLALEGQSRRQIAAYLETTFGLTETEELLDRVLRDVRPPT